MKVTLRYALQKPLLTQANDAVATKGQCWLRRSVSSAPHPALPVKGGKALVCTRAHAHRCSYTPVWTAEGQETSPIFVPFLFSFLKVTQTSTCQSIQTLLSSCDSPCAGPLWTQRKWRPSQSRAPSVHLTPRHEFFVPNNTETGVLPHWTPIVYSFQGAEIHKIWHCFVLWCWLTLKFHYGLIINLNIHIITATYAFLLKNKLEF